MQVNKDLAVISQTRQASCRRLSFAVRFNERLIEGLEAKPLPLWALAPLIKSCR